MSAEFCVRGPDGAALVRRIAGGDESAFSALYDATCGLIYGLLLRILGSPAAAEQILADVYRAVWEQAATFDDKGGEPLTWLMTTARHRAVARLRADGQNLERRACLSKTAERVLTTIPETDDPTSEQQRIVRSAFAALPPVQQQMIELAYFSGLSQDEIAARLGLSPRTVQTGMRAGMSKLRDAFESRRLYPA